MSDAFVQGGSGEIALSVVLSKRDKAFWNEKDQRVAADTYEAKHPGVTVKRPWETPAEHAKRVERNEKARVVEPTLGMDPERAKPELLRAQRAFAGLTVDHPKYSELFDAWTAQINALEAICGVQKTEYVKGQIPMKAEDFVSPELTEKLIRYQVLNKEKRKASILAGKDIGLLTLIRDNETMPELQALAVQRIEQVRAL